MANLNLGEPSVGDSPHPIRMTQVKNSVQFVGTNQIPRISEQSPIAKVFQSLQEANTGGLIVEASGNLERHYIDGKVLADVIVSMKNVRGHGWLTNTPLSNIIHEPEVSRALVKVDDNAIRADEDRDLVALGSIFPVREDSSTIGWYFSDEQLVRSLKTSPPKFVCKQGHENPDPDHGTCYQCPFEIIGTR